jgi:conjugal transfer pilus assembly protein TraF
MKKFLISFIVLMFGNEIAHSMSLQNEGFYTKHGEGWFWYKDPLPIEDDLERASESKEINLSESQTKKLTPEERATKEILAYKKLIENKKNLALVHPTFENVGNYMRIQQDMMQKARAFGQVWQNVVLNEPELNFERTYPTAQYARHIQNDEQQKQKESLIRNLSQEYGLFYFFKGGCPACEGFSPIVKLFADKYSWEVMAISIDGAPNSLFENIQRDNGMAEGLGIRAVPALIAYHPTTVNLIPISYAMTSLDRLEDNILTILQAQQMRWQMRRGGSNGR